MKTRYVVKNLEELADYLDLLVQDLPEKTTKRDRVYTAGHAEGLRQAAEIVRNTVIEESDGGLLQSEQA